MGYDAEQKYNKDVEEKGTTADLHLYRHFKMALHDPKVAHFSRYLLYIPPLCFTFI